MEMLKGILIKLLEKEEVTVDFPNFKLDSSEIVETRCYQALRDIRAVLEKEHLSDADCFERIEEIVCVLEELGSGGGNRHDFG